jgi:hypothetical protein
MEIYIISIQTKLADHLLGVCILSSFGLQFPENEFCLWLGFGQNVRVFGFEHQVALADCII